MLSFATWMGVSVANSFERPRGPVGPPRTADVLPLPALNAEPNANGMIEVDLESFGRAMGLSPTEAREFARRSLEVREAIDRANTPIDRAGSPRVHDSGILSNEGGELSGHSTPDLD